VGGRTDYAQLSAGPVDDPHSVRGYPLHEITVVRIRPMLHMLFLAVAVVLLITCANLAGLLLVRAIHRQRETAVRLAVGAPARTLLGQTILESLIVSVTGGILGIGLAGLALAIGKNHLPANLPLTSQIALNWTVRFRAAADAAYRRAVRIGAGLRDLAHQRKRFMKEGARSGSQRHPCDACARRW